jgi:hypothetical protein
MQTTPGPGFESNERADRLAGAHGRLVLRIAVVAQTHSQSTGSDTDLISSAHGY